MGYGAKGASVIRVRRSSYDRYRQTCQQGPFSTRPTKRLPRLDIADLNGDNVSSGMRCYSNYDCQ